MKIDKAFPGASVAPLSGLRIRVLFKFLHSASFSFAAALLRLEAVWPNVPRNRKSLLLRCCFGGHTGKA
jgi:hypothetical protein